MRDVGVAIEKMEGRFASVFDDQGMVETEHDDPRNFYLYSGFDVAASDINTVERRFVEVFAHIFVKTSEEDDLFESEEMLEEFMRESCFISVLKGIFVKAMIFGFELGRQEA